MDFFPFVMYLFHSFKDLHTDTSYVLYNVFSHATYGCANDKKKVHIHAVYCAPILIS